MVSLTKSPAWQALAKHYESIKHMHMRELFAKDPARFERFSLIVDDFLLDYSKNRIDAETMQLLQNLAKERDVEGQRTRMFRGDKINTTENRSVLHVALRNQSNEPIYVDGRNVMPQVRPYSTTWGLSLTQFATAHGGVTPTSQSPMWSISVLVALI